MLPAVAIQVEHLIPAARHPRRSIQTPRGMIPKRDITEQKTIRLMNAAVQIATAARSLNSVLSPPLGGDV